MECERGWLSIRDNFGFSWLITDSLNGPNGRHFKRVNDYDCSSCVPRKCNSCRKIRRQIKNVRYI